MIRLLCCFFCIYPFIAKGQYKFQSIDLQQFEQSELCHALLRSDAILLDSSTFMANYHRILSASVRREWTKAGWVLHFLRFKNRGNVKLSQVQVFEELEWLEKEANAQNWPVEALVARHYHQFELFSQKKTGYEKLYAHLLDEFDKMDAMGMAKFADYEPADLMLHGAKFLFQMEDQETALRFLFAGEPFLEPMRTRYSTHVLMLNHIQAVFQQQREFDKAIGYAEKILRYTDTLEKHRPEVAYFCRFWRGLVKIDIASMLIQQQKYTEGERFADEGYALAKVEAPNADVVMLAGEFDALMPLISIKLERKKWAEATTFIHRAEAIWEKINREETNYFKPIKLWENKARLAESKGDFAASYQFQQMAKPLHDSLEKRNDVRKLEKIQQLVAAQKYTAQIRAIEQEKQAHLRLRNMALLMLLLVSGAALVAYRRLQHKRQQALVALAKAEENLKNYVVNFKEKSEQLEALRAEIQQAANHENRGQHLQTLMQSTILNDDEWVKFRATFEAVYPNFIAEQKSLYPDLTQAELRYLVLENLQLSTHEMANMLGVSDVAIRQTRSRLRKKTGLFQM